MKEYEVGVEACYWVRVEAETKGEAQDKAVEPEEEP